MIPNTPFSPSDPRVPGWSIVRVSTINGVAVDEEPLASFALPDASVATSNPVPVVFAAENIPIDAVLLLKLISPEFGVIDITATFSNGDAQNST